MNNGVNKPDIANGEPRQGMPGGILAVAAISILAGVSSGVGAIAGIVIGKKNGISWGMTPFGIIGMLLISGALIWIVSPKWRRRYIAALPMFWLLIGGALIKPLFVSPENLRIANIVIISIAIFMGQIVGEYIMNRR